MNIFAIVGLILAGGIIALILMLEKRKTSQMISKGIAVKRSIYFYKSQYTFITNASDLAAINSTINSSVLSEAKIFSKWDFSQGWIKFENHAKLGTFDALLEVGETRNERHTYHFRFLSWSGPEGEMNRHDVLSGNILLTAVEKAFIALDPDTGVEQKILKTK